MATKTNTCAACGYPHLRAPQRSASGGASHEICPACGFEPGYTDDDQEITPAAWGRRWKANGSAWFSKGIPQPADWNPTAAKTKNPAAKKATNPAAKRVLVRKAVKSAAKKPRTKWKSAE
jgi:ribosomal protein L37E